MTKRERIMRQARFEPVDRIPLLGGWMNSAAHLQALAGITIDEFWEDAWTGGLRAYEALDVDGMIGHIIPRAQDSIRQSNILDAEHRHQTVEDVIAFAEGLPSEGEVFDRFDADAVYREVREHMESQQARYGEIQWMPARWNCVPTFSYYGQFGYATYFEAVALHPDIWERVFRVGGIVARERNKVVAKVYRDLNCPPLILTGEDICHNGGPMVSPDFLRRYYWEWVRYALEPLVKAGIKPICHCDGNVMPIMDDILASGFQGLQGFQEELGVHLSELVKRRTSTGDRLVFFTGMVVTRTLPHGNEQDVRDDVSYAIDVTDGGKGLFLFPANVINPEVPIENIRAAYAHAKAYSTNYATPPEQRLKEWPWGVKTGELIYV